MFTITTELVVTVLDDIQARKIIEAVNSGRAEMILKSAILYNDGGNVEKTRVSPSMRESSEPLQMVATKAKARPKDAPMPAEEPKPERPAGLLGRRRFERKG